jgi:Phosphopantetheine attachment site
MAQSGGGVMTDRELGASAPGQSRVTPTTEIERVILGLWRQVLRTDQVGLTESLYDLGGDSVIASRILAGMNESFRIDLQFSGVLAVLNNLDELTIERLAQIAEDALVHSDSAHACSRG